MIHPLVKSGGGRHLSKLVAEDVLVEDFADPKDSLNRDYDSDLVIVRFAIVHRERLVAW